MWLLRLYPRAWRARYGSEMAAMLENTRFTPAVVLDLVAGAIDAHVAPQASAASATEKEKAMLTNMMKRCAVGSSIPLRNQVIGATVMLGSCLLFAIAYVVASARYPGNDVVDALGPMGFFAALLLSMPFTYLSRHSNATKAIIVVGSLAFLVGIAFLAAAI